MAEKTNNTNQVQEYNFVPMTPSEVDTSVASRYDISQEVNKIKDEAIDKIKEKTYQPTVTPLNLKDVMAGGNPIISKEMSVSQIPDVVKSARASTLNSYYGRNKTMAGLSQSEMQRLSPYTLRTGTKVSVDEMYDTLNDGSLIPKWKTYTPGLDNEDINARRQSTGEKWFNAAGKLVSKTLLYGVGGVAGAIAAIPGMIEKGSISGVYDNSFTNMIDDVDKVLNHTFAHYYRKEERDMNLWQKAGTANFWADTVVGSGISFTTGAMLSGYITGGLGMASLGSTGARIGMRVASNMNKFKMAGAATRSAFSQIKTGAVIGKSIGNSTKLLAYTGVGAGWESSVEARSFLKESEEGFKDYFESQYLRMPTEAEMTDFRVENEQASNAIFGANMAILATSNYLLLGKYLGLDSKFVSKYVPVFKNISEVSEKAGRMTNRYLFGVGSKPVKSQVGKMVATEANRFQKIFGTTWNISKRPLSEGVFEEGTQGIVSKTAEDYIKSRYDKTYLRNSVTLSEAFSKGLEEQYSTKEGWIEIGTGAIIGALFGARQGLFGITERRNQDVSNKALVNAYNNNNTFTTAAVKDLFSNMTAMSASNMAEKSNGFSKSSSGQESEYNKFSMSDRMGMLDKHAGEFIDMIENLEVNELASELNISEDLASKYKTDIIADYKHKLNDYKSASSFADAITEDTKSAIYRDYVASVAYKGMDAGYNIKNLSQDISEAIRTNPELESGLNIYSALKKEAINKAIELRDVSGQIEDIEKDIETQATSPNRYEGVDEEIRKKTVALEEKRQQYLLISDQLKNMVAESYSEERLLSSQSDLLSDQIPTSEQVLEALDSVRAIDEYIKRRASSKDITSNDKNLMFMVAEYKDNVVNHKNILRMMSDMTDPRFMRKSFLSFKEEMNKFVTPYGDRTIQRTNATGFIGDEKIDEQLASGKISEDDAFTLKVFNHLMDDVAEGEGNKTDLYTQEDYDAEITNIRTPGFIGNIIATKILAGGESTLTPIEKEIYDLKKDVIDNHSSTIGIDASEAISALRNKVDRYSSIKDIIDANNFIIDLAIDNLDDVDAESVRDAIKTYNDLKTKQEKGENIDEDVLNEAINVIKNKTSIGAFSDVLPFVEQNRIISLSGNDSASDVVVDYGNTSEQIDSVLNDIDTEDKTPGVNIDSAQNPEIVMVIKKEDKAGNVRYNVSDLKASVFISRIVSSIPFIVTESKSNDGDTIHTITFENGDELTLEELPDHARWAISPNGAYLLSKNTNISINEVGTSYSFVGQKMDDGFVVPMRSGVGFGVNETDKIDQEELSRTKEGDTVELVVDVNDTYNQRLLSEFNDAVLSDIDDNIQEASDKLISGVVIKVMRNGKLISVVKAGASKSIAGLRDLRAKAAEVFAKNEGKASEIGVGSATVSKFLPGKPVFNMVANEDGSVSKTNIPITEKGAKKIVDVGYILNGKIHLKEKSDYSIFPFASKIVSDQIGKNKGVKIPVIVIKGNNGVNYVYPVSLRGITSSDANFYLDAIGELLSPINIMPQQDEMDYINLINTYLTSIGLNPAEYHIPYANNRESLLKATRAIEKYGNVANVNSWLYNKSRSVKDIAMQDIDIDINMEEDVFIAPKIRLNLASEVNQVVEELEDDLPFNIPGVPKSTSKETPLLATSPATSPATSLPVVEPLPADSFVEPAPERKSAKGLSSIVDSIAENNKAKGIDQYRSFADFICQMIASSELRFLANAKSEDDLRRFLGLDPKKKEGTKIMSGNGLTVDQYIEWLKSRNENIVKDYVEARTDDQLKMELKSLLGYIKYKPSGAINYSLKVNGMPVISEYSSPDDVQKMEDSINNILSGYLGVSQVLPEAEMRTTETTSEAVSTVEIKEEVVVPETEAITEIKVVELDEAVTSYSGIINTVGESDSYEELLDNVSSLLKNSGLPVMDENEIMLFLDNYLSEAMSDASNLSAYGVDADYVNKLNKFKDEKRIKEESDRIQPQENDNRKSDTQESKQPRRTKKTQGDVSISGTAERTILDERSITPVVRVTVPGFLYAGKESYTSLPGEVSEIPAAIMNKNGIKEGMGFAQLQKSGYVRLGSSWMYKFYMNTGIYDLYNMNTGEAFRFKPFDVSIIKSSKFAIILSQKGRLYTTVDASPSIEEQSRNSNVISSADTSDAKKESNKPC